MSVVTDGVDLLAPFNQYKCTWLAPDRDWRREMVSNVGPKTPCMSSVLERLGVSRFRYANVVYDAVRLLKPQGVLRIRPLGVSVFNFYVVVSTFPSSGHFAIVTRHKRTDEGHIALWDGRGQEIAETARHVTWDNTRRFECVLHIGLEPWSYLEI